MTRTRALMAALLLCTAGAVTSTRAVAADPAPVDSAKAQYDAERARCTSGTTGQDQASCLRSAGAAYDAIRGNRLQDPNTSYRDNAMMRCKSVPAAERADCESRVDGGGTSAGSVKGGGVVKETVTTGIPVTSPTVPPAK